MKKYYVQMEVTSHFTIEVEAESIEEAVDLANEKEMPKSIEPEEISAVSATDEDDEEFWDC